MCRRLDLLHGGASLRNWQNVQGLAELGPVDVVSVGPDEPLQAVSGVRHYQSFPKWRFKRGPLDRLLRKKWLVSDSAHPMLETHYDASVAEWIGQRIRRYSYDVLVVEELAMARYVTGLNTRVGITIFDAHNVESLLHGEIGVSNPDVGGLAGRWKRSLLDSRLRTAERAYAGKFDRIWSCSPVDQSGLQDLLGGAVPVDVIPNSIDVSEYDASGISDDWSGRELTLVYLGSYSYYPNEQAALLLMDEVLPILRTRNIPAKLLLIGSNPTESMKAAAEGHADVVILGKVDSILPYLKEPCVVVLPLRLGSGTRLKILEAFACGRPVVSTAKGVEGIDAVDGTHLLVRESAGEMADAAVALWMDRELRGRICRNALELVSDCYSHQNAARLIRESLRRTMGTNWEGRGECPSGTGGVSLDQLT